MSEQIFRINPSDSSLEEVKPQNLPDFAESEKFMHKKVAQKNRSSGGNTYFYYDLEFINRDGTTISPIFGNFQLLSPISERYNFQISGETATTTVDIQERLTGRTFKYTHWISAMDFWEFFIGQCYELTTVKELELTQEIGRLESKLGSRDSFLKMEMETNKGLRVALATAGKALSAFYDLAMNELPPTLKEIKIPAMALSKEAGEIWEHFHFLKSIAEKFPHEEKEGTE